MAASERSKLRQRDFLWNVRGRLLLTACIALLTTGSDTAAAKKTMRQLTAADLAQVWVGLSEDELYMVRLDLHADGTGVGGYVFADEDPVLFAIEHWDFHAPKIEICSPAPDGMHSLGECLRGSVVGSPMKLTAQGRDWRLHIALRKEMDLEGRWKKLKDRLTRR